MSIFETLASMNFPGETIVNLSYSGGTDVFIHNESEIETALDDTDVIETFSALVSTPGLAVADHYGHNVLSSLREDGLLEAYERDGTFAEYLSSTITDNFYDCDLIEYSTEKFDHKRGFTTLSAQVQITLENFLETIPDVENWEISVKTEKGTLIVG